MATKRIEKAINIFLDAINNGTLVKGDCTKCAVGNLVRVGCGYSLEEYNETVLKQITPDEPNSTYINWSMIFCTPANGMKQQFEEDYSPILKKYPEIKKQFDSVDFSVEELASIEYAFEKNTTIRESRYVLHSAEEIREDQIKGLEAVVKVMLSFDKQKDEIREVFTSKAELIEI